MKRDGTWEPMLIEYQGNEDDSRWYQYAGVVNEWSDDEPESELVWTCEPDDSEEFEIAVSAEVLAGLLARARAHCEGCQGCGRAKG